MGTTAASHDPRRHIPLALETPGRAARHAADQSMNDLDEIYKRLARDWQHEELAAGYARAREHGARAIKNPRPAVARALPMVASALPPAATQDVAVYVLHMLRTTTHDELARRLIGNAEQSTAAALHRCRRALEVDSAAHSYTAEEWLPVVCDRAAELLEVRPPERGAARNDGARGPRRDQLALPRPHRARRGQRRDRQRPQRSPSAPARLIGLRRSSLAGSTLRVEKGLALSDGSDLSLTGRTRRSIETTSTFLPAMKAAGATTHRTGTHHAGTTLAENATTTPPALAPRQCHCSYLLVFTSIANATPSGPIAAESMSLLPDQRSECRTFQPSATSFPSAPHLVLRPAPTRLRAARSSQWRA